MSEVKICPTCNSEYPVSERFCPRDGSALKSQNAGGDLVGTMIAQSYHVIRKLGEGGMGAVYLAEHVKMGRKSAIKVMNPGMNQDPDAIARFNREASNASKMNHPNICAIYDFGETAEGIIYLAMEFIEGQSLSSLIEKNGALPPARAASILDQTASGLQVAHDYGIVHRDLKPDNIMIARGRDNSDLVKVVDFGIAKSHKAESQKVTKTGLVVGTPEYMSPEQLAGDKLDGRSDIYSLALVGFNMLTGTLPFPSETAQEAMIMRLTDKPKSLAEMKPNVAWPAELERVMEKALSRSVDERYQKASDFGREFSMAVEAMPTSAMTEGATMVVGAASASAKTAPVAAVPKTRVATPGEAQAAVPAATPTKSSMGMFAGIGGGVAVAAVVVLYVTGVIGGKPAAGSQPAASPDSSHTVPKANPDSNKQIPADNKNGKPATPSDGKSTVSKQNGSAPPSNGNTPPTGGGGNSNPGGASAPAWEPQLAKLETLADETTMTDARAQQAISLAGQLLAQNLPDSTRALVLFRRGVARIHTELEKLGCADIAEARGLVPRGTTLRKQLDVFFTKVDANTDPTCSGSWPSD